MQSSKPKLSAVKIGANFDEVRKKDNSYFPPKVARKILNLSSRDYRRFRLEIDPEGDTRKDGFSHNTLFAYFILQTFREWKTFNIKDLEQFNWSFVFRACEEFELEELREMGIVYCPIDKELWLLPISAYYKVRKKGNFEGLIMERVYHEYNNRLAVSFDTLLERRLTLTEKKQLILSQPGTRDILSSKSRGKNKKIARKKFDEYFKEELESLE